MLAVVACLVCLAIGSSVMMAASYDAAPHTSAAAWLGIQLLASVVVIVWRNRTQATTPWTDNFASGSIMAMSLLMTAYVLLRMPVLGIVDSYAVVFLAWLCAILLFVIAMTLPWRFAPIKVDSRAAAMLVAVVMMGAVLRLWRLDDVPYVFGGDESAFALWAEGLTASGFSNPFGFGFMSQPTLGIMLQGLVMKAAGSTEAGSRLTWAVLGTMSLVPTYLLANKIGGRVFALAATALIALYHFHIHYSRTALNNIADLLFMGLALWSLVVALERRSNIAWIGVGLSCGLALYFYQGARLTPLVIAAVLGYATLFQDRLFRREALRGSVIAVGAFLVSAAPMFQSAVRFPEQFNARIYQVSILMPGWLEQEGLARGQSVLRVLWEQFTHAALAFNVYPDLSDHYGLHAPLLDPLFGSLFALGLVYATVKALLSPRHWVLLTVAVWWWAGTLLGGAMTLSPPSSQRLVTLSVPVCIFIVIALVVILDAVRRCGAELPKAPILASAVALFGAISLKTYLIDFTPSNRPGSLHGVIMTELARTLKRGPLPDKVYFLGAPHLYWDYPTIAFLVPQAKGEDVLDPMAKPPASGLVVEGQDALFVVLPHRKDELALIRDTFSNGTESVLVSPVDQRILATLYRVSR